LKNDYEYNIFVYLSSEGTGQKLEKSLAAKINKIHKPMFLFNLAVFEMSVELSLMILKVLLGL